MSDNEPQNTIEVAAEQSPQKRKSIDLLKLPRTTLLELCKAKKLKGCSGKKKEELVKLLRSAASGAEATAPTVVASDSAVATVSPAAADPFEALSPTIRVAKGDCLALLPQVPDDSVDLILCDLPYGTTKCKWDSVIDVDALWAQYRRVLKKPTGVVVLFSQQPFTTRLIAANYEWHKYNFIWKKNKTTQFLLANYRPMKCTEDICVFSPGGAAAASRKTGNMTYNPQGLVAVDITKKNSEKRIGKMLNQPHHLGPNNKLIGNAEYKQNFTNYPTEILEFDIENDTIHETQKPVKLIEYLIRTFSNPGGLVLDNTMGSGTTGIGCITTGRQFLGMELEPKYYDLSVQRLKAALEAAAAAEAPTAH